MKLVNPIVILRFAQDDCTGMRVLLLLNARRQ
jgi:hypothetical protein